MSARKFILNEGAEPRERNFVSNRNKVNHRFNECGSKLTGELHEDREFDDYDLGEGDDWETTGFKFTTAGNHVVDEQDGISYEEALRAILECTREVNTSTQAEFNLDWWGTDWSGHEVCLANIYFEYYGELKLNVSGYASNGIVTILHEII